MSRPKKRVVCRMCLQPFLTTGRYAYRCEVCRVQANRDKASARDRRNRETLAARFRRTVRVEGHSGEPAWLVDRLIAAAEARRKRIGRLTLTEAECWAGAGISTVYAEAGVGAEA